MNLFRGALLFLFLTAEILHAQDRVIPYEEEYVLGVNMNTNAGLLGGFMFRYAKKMTPTQLQHFAIEIINVKHAKEVRYPNPNTGNLFILGKTNYLFALRPSYGREFLIFTKGREDGIQVNAIVGIGPTLGIQKPYFIKYNYDTTTNIEAFDPTVHTDYFRIEGTGGFLTGFGKSRLVPGAHIKGGFSFEYGSFATGVTGVEVGGMIEGYTKRVEILNILNGAPSYNRQVFSSIYLNIYFGWR